MNYSWTGEGSRMQRDRAHLDRVHPVHSGRFEDRVVCLVRGVEDAVWEVLSANQDAMKIAFCPAVGDVTPVVILVYLPEPGKPLEDSHLQSINSWDTGACFTYACA